MSIGVKREFCVAIGPAKRRRTRCGECATVQDARENNHKNCLSRIIGAVEAMECACRGDCLPDFVHLARKIDINADGTGEDLVKICAQYGSIRCLKSLTDRWKMDVTKEYGGEALYLSAHHGQADCVRFLLQRGADPLFYHRENNANPIHVAVSKGHTRCVTALIEHSPGLISTKTLGGGDSVLHVAFKWGMWGMFETLVGAGADLMARNAADNSSLLYLKMDDGAKKDGDAILKIVRMYPVKERHQWIRLNALRPRTATILSRTRDNLSGSKLWKCVAKISSYAPRTLSVFRFVFIGEKGSGVGVEREFFEAMGRDVKRDYLSLKNTGHGLPRYELRETCTRERVFGIGGMIALAFLHRYTVPIPFHTHILKGLTGEEYTKEDLKEYDPEFYNNLYTYLDECSEDELEDLHLEMPTGRAVTKDNLDRYRLHVMNSTLMGSNATQAFLRGFNTIVGVGTGEKKTLHQLYGFTARDLDDILFGGEKSTVLLMSASEWRQNTTYIEPTDPSCRTVEWFWDIVEGMSREDRSVLNEFCTGSRGMTQVAGKHHALAIRVEASLIKGRLPSSATCANTLNIPPYKTKRELEKQLNTVINLQRDHKISFEFL